MNKTKKNKGNLTNYDHNIIQDTKTELFTN